MLKNKPVYIIHLVYFLTPFLIFGLSFLHKGVLFILWFFTFYSFIFSIGLLPLTLLIYGCVAYGIYRARWSDQRVTSLACFLVGWIISAIFLLYFLS
jgi:hypothetical protein